MQFYVSPSLLLLLVSFAHRVISSPHQGGQVVLAPTSKQDQQDAATIASASADAHAGHVVDETILAALNAHSDPVDALIALQPELAAQLAESRLIHVFGEEKPVWRTEGDKLRLRRQHKKFMDITDHQDLYTSNMETMAGKASKIPSLGTSTNATTCPLTRLLQTSPN